MTYRARPYDVITLLTVHDAIISFNCRVQNDIHSVILYLIHFSFLFFLHESRFADQLKHMKGKTKGALESYAAQKELYQ